VFQLWRDEDPSGVSGVGRVAVGVVLPSGKVVLEWLGAHNTLGIYDDLRRVEHIHGHGGKTRIVFMGDATPYRALFVRAKASRKAHHAVGVWAAVGRLAIDIATTWARNGSCRSLFSMRDSATILCKPQIVGIITDHDSYKYWQKSKAAKVGAVMIDRPLCVSLDDSIAEAVRMFLGYKVGRLPVNQTT
jgi:CBS domain-containing protein